MNKKKQSKYSFFLKWIISLLIFLGTFVMAMVLGPGDITVREVWFALTDSVSNSQTSIIKEIRLPREIGAVFVGAALAVSGAVMQGMTRNPLADPGLLGLTAGANAMLAVTAALFPAISYFGTMIACFAGAALGAIVVFRISAATYGGHSPFRIVLAGAAVSAFLFAISEYIGLQFKVSKDITMWTAGGLIGLSWGELKVIIPFIVVGIIGAFIYSKQLTILSLNEEVAVGLGQNIARVKWILLIIIVILAGAAVALVGNMAFIGLMIPHIVRPFVGTDYQFILPMSAMIGASFMLLADTLGRTINAPFETPVVAIVALLGLPFFLMYVRKGGSAFS